MDNSTRRFTLSFASFVGALIVFFTPGRGEAASCQFCDDACPGWTACYAMCGTDNNPECNLIKPTCKTGIDVYCF